MSSKNILLSRKEKEIGQSKYIKYTFINGLSYSFLAETIIYLLALKFGANNIQLGYISSAVYLTGLVVIFVPSIFPDIKIVKLFFIAWLLRGVFSLFYGFSIFLPNNLALYLIIAVYTIYCILRNIAYPLNHVIQGAITKPSERGAYSAKVIIFLYLSMVLSRFISFSALTFSKFNELYTILGLIFLGIILNTFASITITKVPLKESIKKSSVKNTLISFKSLLSKKQSIILIVLYCCGMSLFVLFNFTIPFLKKELNFQSNIIFIYTTINFLGVILGSKIIKPFLDRFGSRPLLFIVNIALIIISIIWAGATGEFYKPLFFIIGFISMFFIGLIRLLLDRLIINSVPPEDKVNFTSVMAVIFSIFSLFIGLFGGFLADLTNDMGISVPNEYSLTFVVMAFFCIVNILLTNFIKEENSLSLNQLVKSLFNKKQIKTIRNLDRLNSTNNKLLKSQILIEIESDDTQLATEEIKKRFNLATLKDKEMVIRSLFSNPRPELEENLIKEALDRQSWWRQSAIFALGAYNSEQSMKTLRKIFKEKYPYIRSIAAKSLARIGDFSCHEEINILLQSETLDVRTYINLVIAISLIEHDGAYWKTIFRLIKDSGSYRFTQSLLVIGSTRLKFYPPLENFFYDLNINEKNGFESIMEELVDLDLTDEEFGFIEDLISNLDYQGIWLWCRTRCKLYKLLNPFENLRKEILSYKKRNIDSNLALAGLFFTIRLEILHKDYIINTKSTYRPE